MHDHHRPSHLLSHRSRNGPGQPAEPGEPCGAKNPATATASCSSTLRLYHGTSFTGAVLGLSTRGSLIQLASSGFDNVTSSYRVGACSASLYDGLQSGLYPGATGAGSQASVMLSGWDNTISSVVIS